MILTLILCIVTGVLVFLSVLLKPDIRIGRVRLGTYWMVALAGAIALIATGCIPLSDLGAGLVADTAINPLKILTLFLSMTALSVFLDEVGFFRYLAAAALSRAKGKQTVLFFILFATVSVLTVFTSNDIVVLTFTPFICCFAKNAKIDPLPYLIAEFVASNTWSMALIIGNPTNIYIATGAGISFADYFLHMILPTVFAGATALLLLFLLFRRSLSAPMQPATVTEKIEDKPALGIGLFCLGACTVLLAISSYIGFEMWYLSLGFALLLFLSYGVLCAGRKRAPRVLAKTLRRLPYELIPFVLSMFTVVLSLRYAGITDRIAELLGSSATVWTYGGLSFLAANFINNIPMSVLFSSVLESAGSAGVLAGGGYLSGVYAAVVGSNIGAFLTPVGALAGIMWSSILRENGVRFSFRDFMKYGAILSVPTLAAALAGLCIVFA